MKIASSLKSLKKRDLNSKLVKRRGKLYVINKKNPKFKARQGWGWAIMISKKLTMVSQSLYYGERSQLLQY